MKLDIDRTTEGTVEIPHSNQTGEKTVAVRFHARYGLGPDDWSTPTVGGWWVLLHEPVAPSSRAHLRLSTRQLREYGKKCIALADALGKA